MAAEPSTARSTVAEARTRVTLPKSRWSLAGRWRPGPPGWVRAAAAALARRATRQARPACGAPVAGGCAVGTRGSCSARWRQPPRSGRPRLGCATTVGGRRRA
jgi:hypothetical protein